MTWAKDAAEAIIDDDAVLAEQDARRRRRNAMLTIGALAGGVGLGAGIYANRDAISNWWNKSIAPAPTEGVGSTVAHGLSNIPALGAVGYAGAATKTMSRLPVLGKLISKLKGIGLGSDVGVEGLRGRLSDLDKPENKGYSRQNDVGEALRKATGGGSPSAVAPIQEQLEHFQQNKIDAAGRPVSDLRQAIAASPLLAKSRFVSTTAHEPLQIAAALKHVATSGLPEHEPIVQNIALRSQPAGAPELTPAQQRTRVLELGNAIEEHARAPGRQATGRNMALGAATAYAIPWIAQQLRGLF